MGIVSVQIRGWAITKRPLAPTRNTSPVSLRRSPASLMKSIDSYQYVSTFRGQKEPGLVATHFTKSGLNLVGCQER